MAFRSSARILSLGALALALSLLVGCDNVGRAFDPDKKGGSDPDPATSVQLPPEGGITRSTRAKVLFSGPDGSAFPVTTPVVVFFDQSMNFESIRESEGDPPTHLFVRAQGTDAALPGSYTLLLSGRLLIFTPQAPFPMGGTFEVVLGKTVLDVDRRTVARQGVLATFTVDAPLDSGFKLLTTVPLANDRTTQRESPVFVITTAPATATTITTQNVFLQTAAKVAVPAPISFPVRVGNVPDPRIIQLTPDDDLAASTRFEIKITKDLKAGDVELDVNRKDPAATFTSIGPLEADAARVGNPSTGFDHRINVANLQNLTVAVDVPTGSQPGDRVTVRAYGNDKRKTANELLFVERTATLSTSGQTTTTVSFANALGSVAGPRFKDGTVTIMARMQRGNDLTGYVRAPATEQDTIAPTLSSIGPPAGSGTNVYVTDLNTAALHGKASERVGALALTIGTQTLPLFGSDTGGRFMSMPFVLGRTTTPTAYTLTLNDRAGNPAGAAVSGTIVQRGLLTGNVSGGTLTVTAYDDATLAPVSGASVLIEPGMPTKPATGRMTQTTNASGVATFTGLTQSSYSITLVKAGYHLTSYLDNAAGFASLPMRPLVNGTARLGGVAAFTPGGNQVARVGVNLLADESADSFVQTASAQSTMIAAVPVRPNRPLFVTGFSGVMPPAAKPTFANGATLYGAVSGARGTNQPPLEAKAGGAEYTFNMALLPSLNAFVNFSSTYSFDMSTATGLDTGNLVGAPNVSVLASLSGFGGMIYVGPGFASGSGTTRTIDGSYSLPALLDFGGLGPLLWSSTQAEDQTGNKTRNRALFSDPLSGALTPLVPVAGIPTVTSPAGAFTGSPNVQVADRLSTTVFVNTVALRRIRAKDTADREWTLFYQDKDAATGTDNIQYPDLAGTGLTGLATGTWAVSVEDYLMLGPGLSASELNLEDLPRLELTYAKSAAVDHTVQ